MNIGGALACRNSSRFTCEGIGLKPCEHRAYPFRVARAKIKNLEKVRIALEIVCPFCQAKLLPDKWRRVDGEKVKRAWCGGVFVPQRTA